MVTTPETFYQNELNDALLYKRISKRIISSFRRSRRNEIVANKLLELASIESDHAVFWENVIRKKGRPIPAFKERQFLYYRYLGFLQRLFGVAFLIKYLERGEDDAIKEYSEYIEQESNDKWELEQLKKILADEKEHEDTFVKMTDELKSSASKIKDIVYGMSDALIEVLASVAALTGVFANNLFVAFGGVIIGVSGLISMTIGAYISEKAKGQINTEDAYTARKAATNTATYYAMGAVVPIIPFLFLQKYTALAVSFALVLLVDGIATSVVSIQSEGHLRKDLTRSLGLVVIGFIATFALGLVSHYFIGTLG